MLIASTQKYFVSIDRLQLGTYLYAPTIMSVTRRLTQPCPYSVVSISLSTANVFTQVWGYQKELWRASHLLSPNIPWNHCQSLPLVRASGAVIVPSLLSSDISEVTIALARMTFVFCSDCSEFQRRGSQCLLCSNILMETSTLARPVFNSACTELWHRGPSSLLYCDSSAEVPILAQIMSQ